VIEEFDIEQFRLTPENMPAARRRVKSARLPRHRPGDEFLKGPIPMAWLSPAAHLGRKCLHLAIAVWHLGAMSKSATVRLQWGLVEELTGVQRHPGREALRMLETAGLVTVESHVGRCPIVTVVMGEGGDGATHPAA
jgi:hypothetical protein